MRNSTIARYFVDTNVLVYAFDPAEAEKHLRAKAVITQLGDERSGVLSAQVLMEFFAVATRKLSPVMTGSVAEQHVVDLIHSWEIVPLDASTVTEALRGVRAHGLSLWDAQIWAAARMSRTSVVLSEDFTDGRVIDGIRLVNPFSSSFKAESLS